MPISTIIPSSNSYNSIEMIISPDGSKIATNSRKHTGIVIYQFDKKTGIVDPKGIEFLHSIYVQNYTFSADSKKLYYNGVETDVVDTVFGQNILFEYDISVFNQSKVNLSIKKTNLERKNIYFSTINRYLTLGPNGQMYFLAIDYDDLPIGRRVYLDEITGTNLGQNLVIKKNAVYLGTYRFINDRGYNISYNYLSNYYEHLPKLITPTTLCTGDSLMFRADTAYAETRYKWFIDDSLVSTVAQPKIKFAKGGKHNLTLHINDCLVEKEIEVSPSLVPVLADTSLCEAQPINLI